MQQQLSFPFLDRGNMNKAAKNWRWRFIEVFEVLKFYYETRWEDDTDRNLNTHSLNPKTSV